MSRRSRYGDVRGRSRRYKHKKKSKDLLVDYTDPRYDVNDLEEKELQDNFGKDRGNDKCSCDDKKGGNLDKKEFDAKKVYEKSKESSKPDKKYMSKGTNWRDSFVSKEIIARLGLDIDEIKKKIKRKKNKRVEDPSCTNVVR